MRYLVLAFEGAPMAVDISAGSIRQIILDHPADDVELWSVWQCPPAGSLAPSVEVTAQFASTWAMELATGDTIEDHIASAPAFVVHHARGDLVKWWLRRTAERDENFVPVVLKSAVAA